MRLPLVTCGIAALALSACAKDKVATGSPLAGSSTATAALVSATGSDVGRATATDVAGGIRYTLDVKGLPAGTHGAHVHMTGRCDAPDFTTAGGHWNPTAMKHGTMNPMGPHEGDLPNLIVGSDGRGTLGITVPGADAGRAARRRRCRDRDPCGARRPQDRSRRQQRRPDRLRRVHRRLADRPRGSAQRIGPEDRLRGSA